MNEFIKFNTFYKWTSKKMNLYTVFYAFYLIRKSESMFSSINLTSLVNQTIKL